MNGLRLSDIRLDGDGARSVTAVACPAFACGDRLGNCSFEAVCPSTGEHNMPAIGIQCDRGSPADATSRAGDDRCPLFGLHGAHGISARLIMAAVVYSQGWQEPGNGNPLELHPAATPGPCTARFTWYGRSGTGPSCTWKPRCSHMGSLQHNFAS